MHRPATPSPLSRPCPDQITRLAEQLKKTEVAPHRPNKRTHSELSPDTDNDDMHVSYNETEESLWDWMQKAGELRNKMTPKEMEVLTSIEDHLLVTPIYNMPDKLRRMTFRLHCKHLKFNCRLTLTLFLLQMRVPPYLIAKWYILRNMLHDEEARNHTASIIEDHMNRRFSPQAFALEVFVNYKTPDLDPPYYAMKQPILYPDFGRNPIFRGHWTTAINMLKNKSVNSSNVLAFTERFPINNFR